MEETKREEVENMEQIQKPKKPHSKKPVVQLKKAQQIRVEKSKIK